MAGLIWRVLRAAIPGAILLGVAGLGMREFARMASPGDPTDVARMTRNIPLTMAAWGFGVAGLFALVGALWRGPPPKPESSPEPVVSESGLDPEVEKLLNRLLAESEGEKAAV